VRPDICGAGICYNTADSYTCICDDGYRTDSEGTTCVGEKSKVKQNNIDTVVYALSLPRPGILIQYSGYFAYVMHP